MPGMGGLPGLQGGGAGANQNALYQALLNQSAANSLLHQHQQQQMVQQQQSAAVAAGANSMLQQQQNAAALLAGLRAQQVASVRGTAHHFAGTGHFEALGD